MKCKIGKDLYLGGCIVTREGEPVYIHSSDDGEVSYSPLDDLGKVNREQLNSSWNLSSPDIGMVNLDGGDGCAYLSRKPVRAWRQGLTDQNIIAKLKKMTFRFSPKYLSALKKCILDDYPTFSEALKVSEDIGNPYAFHKRYAVDFHSKRLYYKWHIIGDYLNKKAVLNSKFSHLEDDLKEAMNENT